MRGPGLAQRNVRASWLDHPRTAELISYLEFKVSGPLRFMSLVYSCTGMKGRGFFKKVTVSELLAWHLKARISVQSPVTKKFTLVFRNLPLRNPTGKYSPHMFQLEQSISFQNKGIRSKYSGWLFFWGRCGAGSSLFSRFPLISVLSPPRDDRDTGAVSEALVSHIRKALHTQQYGTWDVSNLISDTLLLRCWNRH